MCLKPLGLFFDRLKLLLATSAWVPVALIALATAARVLAAWRFRHQINLDAGVVALMARHIARGEAFPVFFYGQAHMGSLEAMFSGLFCRLFGISGFAVSLGTAFVACGLPPVVYWWGRDVAGRAAGIAALSLVVVGPGGMFHYNGSPRGGYAAALTLGAFLLWYAARMAARARRGDSASARSFFILGLAAGLAWWSSQLTTAAVLAAALVLLAGFRRDIFSPRPLLSGAGGFFLGSLPLWLFNFRHGWPTFALTGTLHRDFGRLQATGWFFNERFRSLMVPRGLPLAWQALLVLFYAGVALGGLILLVKAFRARREESSLALLSIYLFTAVFAFLYSSSHFARLDTPRYFLPMVAPLAVLSGAVLSSLRLPLGAAWLPVAAILWLQSHAIFDTGPSVRGAADTQRIRRFAETARAHNLDIIHAPNIRRSWNFILEEEFRFVDVTRDFYLPNARAAEAADEIAVMENLWNLEDFLLRAGGGATRFSAAGFPVHHRFTPPPDGVRTLPPQPQNPLTRPDADHVFRAPPGQDAALLLTFPKPTPVAGIRLWPHHPLESPRRLSVEVQLEDGRWETAADRVTGNPWFWSGPRPYFGEPFSRVEIRFPAREARAVRVRHFPGDSPRAWSVRHLDVLTPHAPWPDARPHVAELMEALTARGISFLYADRWESLRVHRESGGEIQTHRNRWAFRGAPVPDPHDLPLPAGAAILLHRSNVETALHALRKRPHATFEEVDVGPWRLLVPAEPAVLHGLHWNGMHFTLEDARHARVLHERGREVDPALHPWIAREAPPPQRPAPVRFRNGVVFEGFDLSARELPPGETFTLRCVWRVPPGMNTRELAVFVHFTRERIVFQDDHVFMEDVPGTHLAHPPDSGRFDVTREIRVPADLPPGPLTLRIGLYHRQSGKRIPVRTDLPHRSGAVEMPVALEST